MTLDMETAPKTDQLNYDNIPNGKTITITVTRVTANTDPKQPRSVHYDGDNGKPYKPGLSMRRIMEAGWGDDGTKYVGRSMTLFGDPAVRFGPDAVGGIRISHMSHMEKDLIFSLTVSRGKRKPYIVKQLKIDMGNVDEEIDVEQLFKDAREEAKSGKELFMTYFNSHNTYGREALKTIMPELQKICGEADKEIPVDPTTSQDQEAGNVESEEASPPVDAGSTTPEPFDLIRDDDKKLSCNELICVIEISPTVESVDDLVHLHSNFIEKMNKHERQAILGATNSRKGGLRDA